MRLQHILSRDNEAFFEIERYSHEDLKKAARFWVGKASNNLKRAPCVTALEKALRAPAAGKAAWERLSLEQQQVLAIFGRYGPTVSGAVLSVELDARGMLKPIERSSTSYRQERDDDPVWSLADRFLLISSDWQYYNYWIYGNRSFPTLTLHPAMAKAVSPATPLPWKPSAPSPAEVKSGGYRTSATVALDLSHVAQALQEMKTWQLVQGGMLSKGSLNRLRKLTGLPAADETPLALPDPHGLYYEVLHILDCLDVESGTVSASEIENLFRRPAPEQAWNWVRTWLDMRLWQDGIGVVPDRDSDRNPVRIDPASLRKAKEILVWALCRVACGPNDWLDLETFLRDLWRAMRRDSLHFYWRSYCWKPAFELAKKKDSFPGGEQRSYAYFLDCEGIWIANAIMVTMFALGLVERGQSVARPSRHCFRLTDLGRGIFGSPESEFPDRPAEQHFLTVQPNHEVLAYLDSANAAQVAMLSRIAARTSTAGGQVQSFALRRDTVCRGLESGLSLEAIQSFLVDHGKTPLPDNVARALADWASKRESLVLRRRVTLAVTPRGIHLPEIQVAARPLDDCAAVLPAMSSKQATQKFSGWLILDHHAPLPKTWSTDERGRIRLENADSVSQVRLSRIAEPAPAGWQITEQSVTQARKQGMNAEQVLMWLRQHLTHIVPPLLETALRNWTGRVPAFLGKLLMFRAPNPQACNALLTSPAFLPLIVTQLPPDWFIIHNDKFAEAKRLLKELGFALTDDYQPAVVEQAKDPVPKRKSRRRP